MMLPPTHADLASLEIPVSNESSESSAELTNPSDDEGIRDLLDDAADEAVLGNFALNPRSGSMHVCSEKGSTTACGVFAFRLRSFPIVPMLRSRLLPYASGAFPMVGLNPHLYMLVS
eukprot:781368-Amphidinium_carterae.3